VYDLIINIKNNNFGYQTTNIYFGFLKYILDSGYRIRKRYLWYLK